MPTKLEELKAAANAAYAAWDAANAVAVAYQEELEKPKMTKLEELKAAAVLAVAYDACVAAEEAWDVAYAAEAAYVAEVKKTEEEKKENSNVHCRV
jgi:cell division protein FtsB